MSALGKKTLKAMRFALLNPAASASMIDGMVAAIDEALTRKRGVGERRIEKRRRWSKKLEARGSLRGQLATRANGRCECGCGRWFKGFRGAATMDHFFGVANAESLETCWLIRADCHAEKTDNKPDAATWALRFIAHCENWIAMLGGDDALVQRYREAIAEARKVLAKAEDRSALGAVAAALAAGVGA